MDNNNQDLFEQLLHLEWFLRRSQMQHLREHGPMGAPYQGQGRILALLKLKPQISQKELSKILDIRSQSLGELLAKLERQGYIRRTPSETDRRIMDISLTETGRTASEEENTPRDIASIFDCLIPEEKMNLNNYLGRLIKQLEQQLATNAADAGLPARPGFGDRHFPDFPHRGERRPPVGLGGLEHFFDRDDPRARDQRPDVSPKDED